MAKKNKIVLQVVTLLLLSISFLSCKNILDEFAKKDTDEALLIQAKIQMNSSLWTEAIATFAQMSTAFRDRRDVRIQHAKAYAGRCGLDLLGLFETLSNNLSSSRLYPILLSALSGATTTHADDCIAAESLMLGISTVAANRTVEENTTLAFISFAKMGAIMAAFADDAVPVNGTVDADFQPCQNNTTPGMPNAYVAELGLSIASESLSEAISSGGLSGADELAVVTNTCTLMAGLGANNFCGSTAAQILADASKLDGVRFTLRDTAVIGIGGAVTCSLPVCACP